MGRILERVENAQVLEKWDLQKRSEGTDDLLAISS